MNNRQIDPCRKALSSSREAELNDRFMHRQQQDECNRRAAEAQIPKPKPQMQQQRPAARHSGELPLLRELSALSRAPSLRDPSTTSTWKPPQSHLAGRLDKEVHATRRRGRDDVSRSSKDEAEDEEATQETRLGWETKIANWIDGGLREGERKQELLKSIEKLLNAPKDDQHAAAAEATTVVEKPKSRKAHERENQGPRRRHANVKERSRSTGRLRWKEEQAEEDPDRHARYARHHHQAPAFARQDVSDDSTSSSEDDLVSHSELPLLERRRTRRGGEQGFANQRALVPHRSDDASVQEDVEGGPDIPHGCGLPWHWSRYKGKSFLEVAGRSLSCGYGDLPRRKCTGSEIIPAPGLNPAPQYYQVLAGNETGYEEMESGGRKHRSLSQKYRPKTFKEMVGQNMLTQALTNAVSRGRIAPFYLFHGPRGTGKTCAARILAAALNCIALEEVLRPCGVCRECLLLFLGKSSDVKEVDVASQNAGPSMRKLLADVAQPPPAGRYKVFILDECQSLTPEAWNMLLKCLEDPPEHAVFILTTSEAEKLPQPATTRCQKFLFSKIKDVDIVARLQQLAASESMEVEMDALELIAARSNGSLRDAETTLDQLSLVGQRITLPVVQELVGLISNAKLAELLDLALIGDTLSTVRCLRELMDTGVEPLALMSQIATLITDILAGGYVPANEKGFFQKHILTKEQLEKLRQALKTLSESEKQIRSSQDQTTWLTAALLQFAPESCPVFHTSSAGTSGTPSVMAANDTSEKETIEWEPAHKQVWDHDDGFDFHNHFSFNQGMQKNNVESDSSTLCNVREERTQHPQSFAEADFERQQKLRDTWMRVLEASQSNIMRQLLWNYGKLVSISVEGGRAVAYLEFQHVEHRTSAERSKTTISQAFQAVLGFPVEVRVVLPGERPNHSGEQRALFETLHQQQQQQQQHQHEQHQEQQQRQQYQMHGPPQTEFINSRSFPGFAERDAEGFRQSRGSWGCEEFSLPEIHSDHEGKPNFNSSSKANSFAFHQTEESRNMLQQSGRRFKLKTVRNFGASTIVEGAKNAAPVPAASFPAPAPAPAPPVCFPAPAPAADVKKASGGSKLISSGLLCWKANRLDDDDDDEEEFPPPRAPPPE